MGARRLTVQLLLLALGGVLALYFKGLDSMLATVYGGGIVLVNTAISIWYYQRARTRAAADAMRTLRYAISSELQRFVVMATLLVLGFGPLGLEPTSLLAGFIALQIGALLTQGFEKRLQSK
jgi:F0F1-type ATP synthase assembly protein I